MKSVKNDIEKFDEYFHNLYESFNSPLKIRWFFNEKSITGLFSIDDDYYKISCLGGDFDIWTYKFFILDKNQNEFSQISRGNSNNKLKVLSTIRSGMEYLINFKNPNSLIFMPSDSSELRKKIYLNFSEELVKKYKYKLLTKRIGDYQIYILYKDINLDIILNEIDKLKDELI